ncbi:MAG: molecular chaperone TorD family protein [Eggerthellaceae bacterium]|nr:molecular chaperone TorD family protein [Eggerthellaceae bacterium]
MSEASYLGNMFKLFSVAFTPATQQIVKVIVEGTLADDMATTWRALSLPDDAIDSFLTTMQEYRGRDAEEVLHELRIDWAHMYMGDKPRVTNTEGLWRFRAEGRDTVRMINRYTNEVADFMRECGVKRQQQYNDCIDYIENECDFAAFLANGPEYLAEMGKDNIELLGDFMDDHMLKWAPGFCEDVQREAQTPYYRALAALMGVFLNEF